MGELLLATEPKAMTIEELLITIAIGVIATLIASGVIWVFRKPIRQALAALDMSTGAVLA